MQEGCEPGQPPGSGPQTGWKRSLLDPIGVPSSTAGRFDVSVPGKAGVGAAAGNAPSNGGNVRAPSSIPKECRAAGASYAQEARAARRFDGIADAGSLPWARVELGLHRGLNRARIYVRILTILDEYTRGCHVLRADRALNPKTSWNGFKRPSRSTEHRRICGVANGVAHKRGALVDKPLVFQNSLCGLLEDAVLRRQERPSENRRHPTPRCPRSFGS
jgi:hypothetical protein